MAAIVQVSQSFSPAGTNRLIDALPRRERDCLLAGCERAGSAARAGDRVVVCGSLHTVGPALEWLRIY